MLTSALSQDDACVKGLISGKLHLALLISKGLYTSRYHENEMSGLVKLRNIVNPVISYSDLITEILIVVIVVVVVVVVVVLVVILFITQILQQGHKEK